MGLEVADIQKRIIEQFGTNVSEFRMEHDILTFEATSGSIKDVISFMKNDEYLRFNFLTDLCGVHYPENDKSAEFCVVYLLHNWVDNVRVRIKTFISEANIEVPTVTDLFAGANWMERETYDFFGIKFAGHPNMKRILNDSGMQAFPMRKEYRLEDTGRSDKDDRFFGRSTNNYEPK